MTDHQQLALHPRVQADMALTQQWPLSVRRLALAMGPNLPPEIPEPLSHPDLHWISQRLTSLRTGFTARPQERLKVMAALTRMFVVYDRAGTGVETAQVRLQTYIDALEDLDADAVVAVIDRWIRGEVPNREAKRYAALPAVIREIVATMPSQRRAEANMLQRLLDARVVPPRPSDPVSLAERRATAERMLKVFAGEVETERSRKAVDL